MNALIIYDELALARRATNALRRAGVRADADSWDIKPWRAEILWFPRLAEVALMEAIGADLIVISGLQTDLAADWLEGWLERWATRRAIEDAALVVMNDTSAGNAATPTASWLFRFAARHHLTMISSDFNANREYSKTPLMAAHQMQIL